MKFSIYNIPVILVAVIFLSSCERKTSVEKELGITSEKIAEVEKNTKKFSTEQLIDPTLKADSFVTLRLYILDGKLIADSASARVVAGNFNNGKLREGGFRIAYMDSTGKELGATHLENIFQVRVCEDQIGLKNIPKGWTEVFIPYNPSITSLRFVEGKETLQQLELDPVYRKMQSSQNNQK